MTRNKSCMPKITPFLMKNATTALTVKFRRHDLRKMEASSSSQLVNPVGGPLLIPNMPKSEKRATC